MTAKKGARAKAPTAQDKKIAQLEAKVEFLDWLHAEVVYSTKVAVAQLVIRMNPQLMEQVAEMMVARQATKGVMPQ